MAAPEKPIIVIKKIKKGGHGHHGGAWKIAYADFVTAMMAFFLLMWLLSISSEQTKRGIAAYFTNNVIQMTATRGTDGVMDGSSNPTPNNTDAEDFQDVDKEMIAKTDVTDAQELGVQPAINRADDTQIASAAHGRGHDNFGRSKRQAQPLNVGKGDSEGKNSSSSADNVLSHQDVSVAEVSAKPKDGQQNASLNKMTQQFLVPNQPDRNLTPETQKEQGKNVKKFDKATMQNAEEQKQDGQIATPKRSKAQQEKDFQTLEKQLKDEILKTPELKKFESNVRVTFTDRGMQIDILDDEKTAMFLKGGAEPMGYTKKILTIIAGIIKKVSNGISISGHTDATPYPSTNRYTNWELSSDRSNAVRRFLAENDINQKRFKEVTGKEATEPLIKTDPKNPANRRVSMLLLYE